MDSGIISDKNIDIKSETLPPLKDKNTNTKSVEKKTIYKSELTLPKATIIRMNSKIPLKASNSSSNINSLLSPKSKSEKDTEDSNIEESTRETPKNNRDELPPVSALEAYQVLTLDYTMKINRLRRYMYIYYV